MLVDEPTRDDSEVTDSQPAPTQALIQYIGGSNQLPLDIIEEILLVHVHVFKAQLPPLSPANSRAVAQTLAPILTTWRCSNITRVFRALLAYFLHLTLDNTARLGDLQRFKMLVAMATYRGRYLRTNYSDDWLVFASKSGNLALLDEWWKLECSPAHTKWFWLSTYRARATTVQGAFEIQVCNAGHHAAIVLSACERGHLALLEWLVDHGAQIQATQDMLDAASANGHVSILAYLAQFMVADPLAYSFFGRALDAACAHGHLDVLAWWYASNLPVHPTKSAFLATLQSATKGTVSTLATKQVINWLDRHALFTPGRPPSSTVARIIMPFADAHPHIVEWLLARNLVVVTPDLLAHTLLAAPKQFSVSFFASLFRIMSTQYDPSGDTMSQLFSAACATGNNMVLSFLCANVADVRYDEEDVLVAAARGGHAATLAWCLTELKLSPSLDVLARVMDAALANGHVAVLSWCRIAFPRTPQSWIPVSEGGVNKAASAGHLEAIKWWVDDLRGREFPGAAKALRKRFNYSSVLSAGLKNGHMHVVEWYIAFNNSDRHRLAKHIVTAIGKGHLDAVRQYFELYRIPYLPEKHKATWYFPGHVVAGSWRKAFVAAASRTGRVDLLEWMKDGHALGDSSISHGPTPADASLHHAGLEAALLACQADCVAFWVDLFEQHGHWQLPCPAPSLFADPTTRGTVIALCAAHPTVLINLARAVADPVPAAIAAGQVNFLDLYHRSILPSESNAEWWLRSKFTSQIPVLATSAGQVGVLQWWFEHCYAEVAFPQDQMQVAQKRLVEAEAATAYQVAVSGGIRLYHVACWWVQRSSVACGVDAAKHTEIWAPVLAVQVDGLQLQADVALPLPPVDAWEASDDEDEQ